MQAVEFEIFGSNAAFHYDKELVDFLSGILFESDSDIFVFSFPDGKKNTFSMSEVFSLENIRKHGAVGEALSRVSFNRYGE